MLYISMTNDEIRVCRIELKIKWTFGFGLWWLCIVVWFTSGSWILLGSTIFDISPLADDRISDTRVDS
jgi:hypothetical protein